MSPFSFPQQSTQQFGTLVFRDLHVCLSLMKHNGQTVELPITLYWLSTCRQRHPKIYVTGRETAFTRAGKSPFTFLYLCMIENANDWNLLHYGKTQVVTNFHIIHTWNGETTSTLPLVANFSSVLQLTKIKPKQESPGIFEPHGNARRASVSQHLYFVRLNKSVWCSASCVLFCCCPLLSLVSPVFFRGLCVSHPACCVLFIILYMEKNLIEYVYMGFFLKKILSLLIYCVVLRVLQGLSANRKSKNVVVVRSTRLNVSGGLQNTLASLKAML